MKRFAAISSMLMTLSLAWFALPTGSLMAWDNQDVGATGVAGSFTESAGVYTLKGSGTFQWANEKFHFVHTPLHGHGTGNGSITVKLTSQLAPNNNAQAGIVIRDNLTPNANQYALTRDPWGTLRFRFNYSTAVTGSGGYNAGTYTVNNQSLPRWLRLERQGNVVTARYSEDGANWTTMGSASNIPLPVITHVGMMVYSGTMDTLSEVTFSDVTTTGTEPIASPWYQTDLGTVGIPGTASQVVVPTTKFEIKGSGAGFYGDSDNGHFVYQEITGNVQIVARVSRQEGGTDLTAPAALMIRDQEFATASKNALISISGGNVVRFQSHANASDAASTITGPGGSEGTYATPYWLKLTRNGSTVTGYYSPDGWNWKQAGSASIALDDTIYIGMAVSSKNNSQLKTAVFESVRVEAVTGPPPATFPVLTDITAGATLIQEIDTATVAPDYEMPANVSTTQTILSRTARVLPVFDSGGSVLASASTSATMAYVVGEGLNLVPGELYILEVEYPDDEPRSMYITNRGADHYRGLATGKAIGDARTQFVEVSAESLSYPQTGTWQKHRQLFYLFDHFQEVVGVRDPQIDCRPRSASDGFHVAITRMKRMNDVRSHGAAIGKIRLYHVSDPNSLYAPINYPPPNLPHRSVFWREEMADQVMQTKTWTTADDAIAVIDPVTQQSDPLKWHIQKLRIAKILGINSYAKDLLEFGANQGWLSYDQNFVIEAQHPGKDLWNRLVPKATEEGMKLFPYYEYKGGIGLWGNGLALQKRAHKLYHGKLSHAVCGGTSAPNVETYECISWTDETGNADLTDPDTLVDAKRVLDRTIGDFKDLARFEGAWFRLRGTHLPMGFAESTLNRFKAENPGDSEIQTTTQDTMIASYESSNPTLYTKYVNWWFEKRKSFLMALRDYLRDEHGVRDAQILLTPYSTEAVPVLQKVGQYFSHIGIVVDEDPATFWTPFFNSLPVNSEKYRWQPTTYASVVSATNGFTSLFDYAIRVQRPINHPSSYFAEVFHSTPVPDPERYTSVDGVSMTYPIGRLFTVADPDLMHDFRSGSGLTVVRHYPLNEDDWDYEAKGYPSPFTGQLGYLSVDCDRAGHHMLLTQARAIAHADPRNLAYLSASSFAPGFPEIMRRFNQAFLAVPALPTTLVTGTAAPSDPNVYMRYVTTPGQGTYIYVVNTSWSPVTNVAVNLPETGNTVKDLVTNETLPGKSLTLDLDPAELRSYWVGTQAGTGTEILNLNFNNSTNLSTYQHATAPTVNQFNDIGVSGTMTGWSITNGTLQLVHDGSGAAGFCRHTDLAGAPNMISVEFDVKATGINAWNSVINFTFGNMTAVPNYGGILSYGNTTSILSFVGNGSNVYRLRVNNTDYAGGSSPINYASTVPHHILWIINTSQQTRSYVGPDGASYSVDDLCQDLWVDNVRQVVNKPRFNQFTSRSLSDFFVSCQQLATFQFDNIVIKRLNP